MIQNDKLQGQVVVISNQLRAVRATQNDVQAFMEISLRFI